MEGALTFLQFIVLGLSLAAPIGPMNVEVMKRGLTEGFLSSWLVGLGGLTGDILLLLAIYFGFAGFMQLTIVQIVMYAAGSLMLGYLAYDSMKGAFSSRLALLSGGNSGHSRSSFVTGLIIAVANPLSLLFWFGIYGSSLQTLAASSWMFSLVCSFAVILGLFLWNLNIVLTVHFSKRLMNEKFIRGITFAAGMCLFGFSIHFAVQLYRLVVN
ncbi:LysE family translocator [Ectobacillus ponti]|uniref:LysE family translocator n=1 Tax=Ectobacillus ponti TaxID=2961894 RepID=A0AA41XA11_9BACI|nr:LysE family transporter [Ectobacillus ponti]MCP8969469.1 LysE family translocator [Ectobacillus ponti]